MQDLRTETGTQPLGYPRVNADPSQTQPSKRPEFDIEPPALDAVFKIVFPDQEWG